MEMKKYKLGEIATFINGRAYAQNELLDSGKYKIVRVGNLSGGNNSWYFSDLELEEDKYCYQGDLLYAWACNFGPHFWDEGKTIYHYHIWKVIENSKLTDKSYLYYLLKFMTSSFTGYMHGSTMIHITKESMEQMPVFLPSLKIQKKIALVLFSIDEKIALNRRMNIKLEQMAKKLYDHWFVQFDFPNADGKPYKASGGKMVWNETLKREIPYGWEVKSISSLIKENIGGDWGKEELTGNYQLKVSCCRGADIESMTDLPTRYILNSNSSKLLKEDDMVVEISGGSPTQSTGRCVLISKEILNSFDNKLICSNFCQALSISEKDYVSYFYHMWKMFYDSDIFFNFEGKTSGIKNFQYDTFVAQKWYFPTDKLAKQFGEIASKNYKMKCALDKENKQLTSLRDRLLPLLMNGQVEVV